METLLMYTFKDKTSARFDTPFFCFDQSFAEKKFIMACNEKDSMIGQFKDDFELYKIGEFNVLTGDLFPTGPYDEGEPELILCGENIRDNNAPSQNLKEKLIPNRG